MIPGMTYTHTLIPACVLTLSSLSYPPGCDSVPSGLVEDRQGGVGKWDRQGRNLGAGGKPLGYAAEWGFPGRSRDWVWGREHRG